MISPLQRATIQHRAREADNALQLLNGMLRDAGLDLGDFPLVRLWEAQRIAVEIQSGAHLPDAPAEGR